MKSSQEIACIAEIVAKPAQVKQVLEVLKKLLELSPKEEGCLRYELHQSLENPLKFTFVERYKDQAAFDAHCQMDYIKHYIDEVLPSLVQSFTVELHHQLSDL